MGDTWLYFNETKETLSCGFYILHISTVDLLKTTARISWIFQQVTVYLPGNVFKVKPPYRLQQEKHQTWERMVLIFPYKETWSTKMF